MLLATALLTPGILVAIWLLFRRTTSSESDTEPIFIDSLRKKLPQDLTEWRTHPRYITSWNHLRRFIAGYGYKLWSFDPLYPSTPGVLAPLGWGYGNPSGFLYTPSQIVPMSPQEDLKNAGASDLDVPGSIPGPDPGIGGLATPRHILWPARHDHGDVVIRVLSVGGDGLHTLKIQRQISTAPEVLIRSNHTLPLFREIVLKDIILGVFPRVTASLAEVFVPYNMPFIAEMNMMEILVQCLEALDFLHQNLIAHLNVTFENFLIDFPPLSHPQARTLAGSPRVFITNFDRAVSFPPSTPITERFCYGEQFSLYQPPQEEEQDSAKDTFLGRKRALESATESRQPTNRKVLKLKPLEIVDSRHRFSPFPVDCWQFASVVLALEPESTEDSGDGFMLVEPVHEIFRTMASDDPTCRPSALEALISLQRVLHPS